MHAGRFACCLVVSRGEYDDRTDKQTDRETGSRPLHYALRYRRGQRNNVKMIRNERQHLMSHHLMHRANYRMHFYRATRVQRVCIIAPYMPPMSVRPLQSHAGVHNTYGTGNFVVFDYYPVISWKLYLHVHIYVGRLIGSHECVLSKDAIASDLVWPLTTQSTPILWLSLLSSKWIKL